MCTRAIFLFSFLPAPCASIFSTFSTGCGEVVKLGLLRGGIAVDMDSRAEPARLMFFSAAPRTAMQAAVHFDLDRELLGF